MFKVLYFDCGKHCVKSIRIRSYSGPYFPEFGLNTERYSISPYSVWMRENEYQNNSEYGHFSRSENVNKIISEQNK